MNVLKEHSATKQMMNHKGINVVGQHFTKIPRISFEGDNSSPDMKKAKTATRSSRQSISPGKKSYQRQGKESKSFTLPESVKKRRIHTQVVTLSFLNAKKNREEGNEINYSRNKDSLLLSSSLRPSSQPP